MSQVKFMIRQVNYLICAIRITSKTPYVAIDERGLVRSIHLFLISCVL